MKCYSVVEAILQLIAELIYGVKTIIYINILPVSIDWHILCCELAEIIKNS